MIKEHKILSYKDKVIFEKIVMGNFTRIPKVFQETEACFMYVEEGSFLMRTPNAVLQFNSGDGMLAKCGDYFFEQNKQTHIKQFDTKAIGAYFYPEIVQELFNFDLSLSDFETHYDIKKIKIDGLIKNFITSIEFLLDNPEISSNAMILTKLKEFLLLLSKTEKAASIYDFLSSIYKPIVYDFKKIIHQNIFTNLSLNELASLCSMSLSSFQRQFSDTFKETPAKYILQRRMEKVIEELLNTNKRISDISYDCGFESTSTFNRFFKKTFGKSPSQYRMTKSGQ
jgi:AraC-like DNA-binding protein